MCFARNMRRNGIAIPDTVHSSAREYLMVADGKRDHIFEFRPGKANARHVACTMHRVDDC